MPAAKRRKSKGPPQAAEIKMPPRSGGNQDARRKRRKSRCPPQAAEIQDARRKRRKSRCRRKRRKSRCPPQAAEIKMPPRSGGSPRCPPQAAEIKMPPRSGGSQEARRKRRKSKMPAAELRKSKMPEGKPNKARSADCVRGQAGGEPPPQAGLRGGVPLLLMPLLFFHLSPRSLIFFYDLTLRGRSVGVV